jgi:hypothetical protein
MANSRLTNIASQAVAQNGTTHTQRTVSSTSVSLINHTLNADTETIFVQFNGADCRVTFDGSTAATASKGFLYTDGTTALLSKSMASKALAIRAAGVDVVLEIQELTYL